MHGPIKIEDPMFLFFFFCNLRAVEDFSLGRKQLNVDDVWMPPLDARKCSFSSGRRSPVEGRWTDLQMGGATNGGIPIFRCNCPGDATLNQSKADIG